jgi:hypothetical protein
MCCYTQAVKSQRRVNPPPAPDGDAGLERIKHLQGQLARAPHDSSQRRELTALIRVEANAYRKSLDVQQATATHDPHSARPSRRM